MLELKVALMSGWAADRSAPNCLLASACPYQVPGYSAPAKSRCAVTGPAEPSTALVAEQVWGLNCARTWIVTGLLRSEPQIAAAWLKTLRRCSPSVRPGLPPTGARGVGSLKPSPAPSLLTMTMVAA